MPARGNSRDASRKLSDDERRVRGRATRRKMLDALKTQLRDHPIRDIKVAHIAEAAGVTPAAFYQYFTGLEDALLALADEIVVEARALTDLMAGDWSTNGGALSKRVIRGFLDFWEVHDSVLRVIELAIDAHDPRFNRVRQAMLNDATVALSLVIANFKETGVQPTDVQPRALAAALVAVVVHVSARLHLYRAWGVDDDDMVDAMADIFDTMITRRGLR